jgi:hypothetical protein
MLWSKRWWYEASGECLEKLGVVDEIEQQEDVVNIFYRIQSTG